VQRYGAAIAVHEYMCKFFSFFFAAANKIKERRGQDGHGQNGQNRFQLVKIRHYI